MEKYQKELTQIVKSFSTLLNRLEERKKLAQKDYIGDRLLTEVKTIDTAMLKLKRDIADDVKEAAEDAKERLQGTIIEGNALTADFALLAPQRVKLTQEEFNEIAERNKGNRTMNAALRTYAKDTGLIYSAGYEVTQQVSKVDSIAGQITTCVFAGSPIDVEQLFKQESAVFVM